MNALTQFNIGAVNHYAPLHYLPFIARAEALLGKPSLKERGYKPCHLRSMSSKQDIARGFGDYAFLTIDPKPRILSAKLGAGFPHMAIRVPSAAFDAVAFSLCRFNVAMTRSLRRGGKAGFAESAENGKYYKGHQIPIARSEAEKQTMLSAHLPRGTMIEVLVHGDLKLPPNTSIVCYSDADAELARQTLDHLNREWAVLVEAPPASYAKRTDYRDAVRQFIETALKDPTWRGNCLEFDRV